MKKSKSNKKSIVVLLILLICAAALLCSMIWFVATHFFVGGKAYPNDALNLNLRDRVLTLEQYDAIRANLPNCVIRWNIPFQNSAYPDDTDSLSVARLSDSDLDTLAYFKNLRQVDAVGCRDYDKLMELRQRYPQVSLFYTVTIGGRDYPQDAVSVVCSDLTDEEIALMAYLPELKAVDATGCRDYDRIGVLTRAFPEAAVSYQVELLGQTFTQADEAAEFRDPELDALMEGLAWLPGLRQVHLVEPEAEAAALLALTEAYPNVDITWEKTLLGKKLHSTQTEFDFSNIAFTSTDPVEAAMAYFPGAEKVIMSDCGIDNETMAAFRERMRPQYKVVWTVYVTKKPIRTDQEIIHSSALQVCFIDEQSQDLKYCEDAIVVDIGHSYVKDISWVKGMPNLKYLILTHNWLRDISPLSTCKNLEYLELYWNQYIEDYTPLQGCTALVDLNISGSHADLEPLKKLTWVKNLWANCRGMTQAEYEDLAKALPDTHIEYRGGDYTSLGWRQVQGYYDMRDIMGLPYNTW